MEFFFFLPCLSLTVLVDVGLSRNRRGPFSRQMVTSVVCRGSYTCGDKELYIYL